MRYLRHLLLAMTCAALATIAYQTSVYAHADYESSVPATGAVVQTAPSEVSITFTQNIQTLGLSIAVTDHDGVSVTDGETQRDPSDHHTATVSLQSALEPGRYVVEWTNASAEDGDEGSGAFSFYIQTQPTPDDLAKDEALDGGHAAPPDADDTHSHMPAEMPTPAAFIEGSVSVVMGTLNDSGVTGTAVVRSLDGGHRSEVTVTLSALPPNTSHMTHVHVGAACSEQAGELGAHLVDVANVVADGSGHGSSVTAVDVAFANVASGENKMVSHVGSAPTTDADKVPIACGTIPAAAGHAAVPVTAPHTGQGIESNPVHTGLPWWSLILVSAGVSLIGAGTVMARVAARAR